MFEPWVTVRVMQDKRTPVVFLSLDGFATPAEAKAGVVKHLKENGVTDDGGEVTNVDVKEDAIEVETDLCGFWITDDDVYQAFLLRGREHAC